MKDRKASQVFRWRTDDRMTVTFTILSNVVIWGILFLSGKITTIVSNTTSLELIHTAKTFYHRDNPFNGTSINEMHFCGYEPMVPILLRILSFVFFNNWIVTALFLSLLSSLAASLLFKRVLIAWNFVQDPVLTSYLFAFFPYKYLSVRCTISTEPLYLCILFFAMIAYKACRLKPLLLVIFVGALTSEHTLILAAALSFTFLRFGRYSHCFKVIGAFLLGIAVIMVLQWTRVGDPFAYFKAKTSSFGFKGFLASIYESTMGVPMIPRFHTFFILICEILIGGLLIPRSFLVLSFIGFSTLYMSMLEMDRVIRAFIPLEILVVLVGFDCFLQNKKFERTIPVLRVIVAVVCVFAASRVTLAGGYSADVVSRVLN